MVFSCWRNKEIENTPRKELDKLLCPFFIDARKKDGTGFEPGYTQMARTLENVFERQMKKHFPDDDNQSSDEDFEEELTETELRKLNKKKANDVNGANDFDDDVQAADIYRSSQKNHMTDHRADLNMLAHHFGMNPMSNGVARRLPGQMAFPRQRMPYMSQVQPFYAPQMYPGHPAFTRFNMNDMARSVAPMFSPMMGMAPPRMAMSPRTPGQLSGQDMQTAATRGATPVATKGESSTSMWTDNRMQDMRGIGHAYPRRPMSSPNGPWQAGGVVPDPRQMVGGWRPPGPTRANGTSLEQNEPFGKGNAGPSQSDRYPIAINERATALGNRPDNDSGKTSSDLPTEVKRSGGPQPSEDDLRFPFITPQQRRSNETRHDAMTASRRLDNKTDNPPSRTFQPATSDERVTSPVGANTPRGKSPLGMQEQDQGKVFTDLTSVKPGQTRPGEKRGNPYSVSSIMGNDEQRTKRSDDERLKFSTLLQEMSQSRKSEPPGIPRAGEPSPGVNKVAQFMDLNTTRNQLPPAFIRQPKSIDHRPAVPNPGEPQQPQSLFGSYSKHAPTSHSPLNPSAVGSPSPFMDMRTRMDPAHLVSREGHAFDPRTLYPSYPSHGELQRHQMLMLQQQQQQMMHMGSMVSAGMPGGVPQEYAYLAQRPMYDAMLGRYKNGDKPATLDELTAKKSRVS